MKVLMYEITDKDKEYSKRVVENMIIDEDKSYFSLVKHLNGDVYLASLTIDDEDIGRENFLKIVSSFTENRPKAFKIKKCYLGYISDKVDTNYIAKHENDFGTWSTDSFFDKLIEVFTDDDNDVLNIFYMFLIDFFKKK